MIAVPVVYETGVEYESPLGGWSEASTLMLTVAGVVPETFVPVTV